MITRGWEQHRATNGAPIYSQTKHHLKIINTIQAYRTSSILSLCVEAAEPPLHFRTSMTSAVQLPQLPIHASSQSYNAASFVRIYPTIPPQTWPSPLYHTFHPSLATLPSQYQVLFHGLTKIRYNLYLKLTTEIIAEYPNHTICYNDGSKSRNTNKTGFAYSIQNITKPNDSEIQPPSSRLKINLILGLIIIPYIATKSLHSQSRHTSKSFIHQIDCHLYLDTGSHKAATAWCCRPGGQTSHPIT